MENQALSTRSIAFFRAKKGKTTFYVDNLGKVTDTVSMTDPKAGNDVYLTIDKNLQISAYKLLEEKLAGIVLSKLSNVLDYDPSAEKRYEIY